MGDVCTEDRLGLLVSYWTPGLGVGPFHQIVTARNEVWVPKWTDLMTLQGSVLAMRAQSTGATADPPTPEAPQLETAERITSPVGDSTPTMRTA